MRFDLIRASIHYVSAPSICRPSGDRRRSPSGTKVAVRIIDPPIVLLLELVFRRAGRRVTPLPKLFDKTGALFIAGKPEECRTLLGCDDVYDILIEPWLHRWPCRLRSNTRGRFFYR